MKELNLSTAVQDGSSELQEQKTFLMRKQDGMEDLC